LEFLKHGFHLSAWVSFLSVYLQCRKSPLKVRTAKTAFPLSNVNDSNRKGIIQ